jgi:hypothetical protein
MFCLNKSFFLFALLLLLPAAFALDAPTVSSSTHPEGKWGKAPIFFEWNAVPGAHKDSFGRERKSHCNISN